MYRLSKAMAVASVIVFLFSSFVVLMDDAEAADASVTGEYEAEVTPFTFPESKGIPVMKALQEATVSVDISIYFITSPVVIGILCDLEGRGVEVRMLVEGSPVGVDTEKSYSMLKKLDSVGGDVRIINYHGCEKVYDYAHNKYAVIDGDTVIVTSENWTVGNFSSSQGNRGWGAVVESTGYAEYMERIFEGDYDLSRSDVETIEEAFPSIETYSGTFDKLKGTYETTTYSATVTPVHSPDNSLEPMKQFMNSATSRLYIEELDVASSYCKDYDFTGDNPVGWMVSVAGSGVDTRFVLNTSYETDGTGEHNSLVKALNADTEVKAAGIAKGAGFTTTHNKGMIADDSTWVGSVNWTPTSLTSNREVAVIIYSHDVSEYYLQYFNTDFNNNFDASQKDLKMYTVTFDADGTKTVQKYLQGDEITPPSDPVKKSDSDYKYTFIGWKGYTEGMTASADATFTAEYEKTPLKEEVPWYYYIIAGLVVLLGIIAAAKKKSKRRHHSRARRRKH